MLLISHVLQKRVIGCTSYKIIFENAAFLFVIFKVNYKNLLISLKSKVSIFFQRVIVQRILPCLTSEFVNPDMVPFVLPNVLLIAEECTKEEYIKLILPDLSPVFRQQEPIQVHLYLKHYSCFLLLNFLYFPLNSDKNVCLKVRLH